MLYKVVHSKVGIPLPDFIVIGDSRTRGAMQPTHVQDHPELMCPLSDILVPPNCDTLESVAKQRPGAAAHPRGPTLLYPRCRLLC